MNRQKNVHESETSDVALWLACRKDPDFAMASMCDQVPVLASTHLCLQLLLQRNTVDLRATTQLLRRDPGAVLRTFAAVAEEFPNPETRPQRLEDCIAGLGCRNLLDSLGVRSSAWEEQAQLALFARHAVVIARHSREVGRALGLCEERAYLVGLLHEPAAFAGELRHMRGHSAGERVAAACSILRAHHAPPALFCVLEAVYRDDAESVWVALLAAAHDLADARASSSGF